MVTITKLRSALSALKRDESQKSSISRDETDCIFRAERDNVYASYMRFGAAGNSIKSDFVNREHKFPLLRVKDG